MDISRGRKRKGSSDVPGAPCFCASPFLFCARQLCGVRHKGSVEGTESASISRISLVPSNSTIVYIMWQISSSYLPIEQWDQKRNFATTAENWVLGSGFCRSDISSSDVGKRWRIKQGSRLMTALTQYPGLRCCCHVLYQSSPVTWTGKFQK